MRRRSSWLAVLLVLGITLWPQVARAQLGDVPPPEWLVPTPFGHPHMEAGGFYAAAEFLMWRQTNTLGNQPVAFRGINDSDGTIGLALGLPSIPGAFIGSHNEALDVHEITGPNTWSPGYKAVIGYKFSNGVAVDLSWTHLYEVRYAATATLGTPQSEGQFSEDTFLTSPVYNYGPQYTGPGNQTGLGSPISTIGLWNASTEQEISFVQRLDMWDINFRVPMQDSECWRIYGLGGPRMVAMWERFKWTTVTPELNGNTPPEDIGIYSNTISNRLYGLHVGAGAEWMLGDTPAGAFSLTVDIQAALYIDFARAIPKYELSDRSTSASHSRRFNQFVPEAETQINFWWYPYEGIVCRVGYDAMGFFNTIASPRPIDYNMGTITPGYTSVFRLFDGFNAGIGFIF